MLILTNSVQIRTSTNLVCIVIQQRPSADKDKDNPQTRKRCSSERQEMFCRNSTVMPRLATQILHRMSAEFIEFCKVSCDMYRSNAIPAKQQLRQYCMCQ